MSIWARINDEKKNVEEIFANIEGEKKSIESAWVNRDGTPTMVFGAGRFVAVGKENSLATSKNGKSWTPSDSFAMSAIRGIAYSSTLGYRAIDYEGRIYASDITNATTNKGLVWRDVCSLDTSYTYTAICYAKDRFVAVGNYGCAYYSTDGETWVKMSGLSSNRSLYSVTYAKDRFVAVGNYGCAYYSTDGETWVKMSGTGSTSYTWRGVTYANSMLVAVGSYGSIGYSSDLETWTIVTIGSENLYSVCYFDSKFVAVGYAGTVCYSADGESWTTVTGIPESVTFYSVGHAYLIGLVAVGYAGIVYTSSDAVSWTALDLSDVVTFSDSYYVVFRNDYVTLIAGSSGMMLHYFYTKGWRRAYGMSVDYKSVTYGNGMFVAVGDFLKIYHSPDGINWTRSKIEYSKYDPRGCEGVTYGNGMFVAVGQDGGTAYSTDGINWTATGKVPGVSATLQAVTYGNGMFVAVGQDGVTAYSTDGINWTLGGTADGNNYCIAYGNGRFVAAGDEYIIYSDDCEKWGSIGYLYFDNLYSAVFVDGKFVVIASNGEPAVSVDGENWSFVTDFTPPGGSFRGLTYAKSKFVAVGSKGRSYSSPDAENWTAGTGLDSTTYYGVCYQTDGGHKVK